MTQATGHLSDTRESVRAAVIMLLARGECSPAEAAKLAGLPRSTVWEWVDQAGVNWCAAKHQRLARMWRAETGQDPAPPADADRRTRGLNQRSIAAIATRIAAAYVGAKTRRLWSDRTNRRTEGEARILAIYLMVCGLGMDRGLVSGLIGRQRKTIDHALAKIEEQRDDPDFDAEMTRLELELRVAVAAEDIAAC